MAYFFFSVLIAGLLWLYWEVRRARSVDGIGIEALRPRLKIETYTGFGRPDSFQVAGRVSKDGGRLSSLNAEFDLMGFAGKFRRNLRRFVLPEMDGVAVQIRVGGISRDTTTSARGRFHVHFRNEPILETGITTYSVRLHDSETRFEADRSVGQIVIPDEACRVGLISDIDDTILRSYIRNKLRMFLHTALTSVSDMQPVPGMASLFSEFSMGRNRQERNPVFYVSGSPANLHDKLNAFMRANRFPIGPILLTSMGRDPEAGFFQQQIFKAERIREILEAFPRTQFVLVGDNGQYDSEIYHQISLEFPGRIPATLIYEVVPRLEARKILPLGQHRMATALDGGLVLYRKGLLSKEGLRSIMHELTSAGVLKTSFNLDRMLARLERKGRESRRFRLFNRN